MSPLQFTALYLLAVFPAAFISTLGCIAAVTSVEWVVDKWRERKARS